MLISKGLNRNEVVERRQRYGSNALSGSDGMMFWRITREIATEPMFLLLAAACTVYFIAGEPTEGIIMLISIVIVSGISFFQEYRSRNAIKALNRISTAKTTVIRDGARQLVDADELVFDDIVVLEEGEIVPADGIILVSNDFLVNESILTGETFAVGKDNENNQVYRGTLVSGGSATIRITAVGGATAFGKIHVSLKEIEIPKTPLQTQISSFVKYMALFGIGAFVVVVSFHYWQSGSFIPSLLQGLTLAMSILPEEIPVAFSTFQALGAFRLLRNNIIVKHPQYVETLGSATVICVDKTGTLTKNEMAIASIFDVAQGIEISAHDIDLRSEELITYAMWSSEVAPFDPMEKAIHTLYGRIAGADLRKTFRQIHEYPLGGRPPFMTHIFENAKGEIIVAAKGAPEAIITRSRLSDTEKEKFLRQAREFAKKGFRVLGVGRSSWPDRQWPERQEEFLFDFLGFIVFDDPPKNDIRQTIQSFHDAGITVKMLTGDYAETAVAIAEKAGLVTTGGVITGEEIMHASEQELEIRVKESNIFARMFPDAKLRIINALKKDGEIVAMTGDGVNDAPALRAAHIGIAMGSLGSEVAKSASALVISDDNLSHMSEAVAMGRKIYDNLKKAIRYIISIHIPIILIVLVPLLLGWAFSDIFSPIHVIFMELIMGPTCSIVYENEPVEPGTMSRPPRKLTDTFLSGNQLFISILQGLVIAAGCLALGYFYLLRNSDHMLVRSVIFGTLLFSNIMLTLINRSFRYTVWQTLSYENRLIKIVLVATTAFILAALYIPGIRSVFGLAAPTLPTLLACLVTAFVCTAWIDIWKLLRKD